MHQRIAENRRDGEGGPDDGVAGQESCLGRLRARLLPAGVDDL